MSSYSSKVKKGLNVYPCPKCGLRYRTLDDANSHYMTFHIFPDNVAMKSQPMAPSTSTSNKQSPQRNHVEPTYPRLNDGKLNRERQEDILIKAARSSMSSLERPKGHKKRKHTMKIESVDEEITTRPTKKTKQKTATPMVSCTTCGKRFPTIDDVKSHVIDVHLPFMFEVAATSAPRTVSCSDSPMDEKETVILLSSTNDTTSGESEAESSRSKMSVAIPSLLSSESEPECWKSGNSLAPMSHTSSESDGESLKSIGLDITSENEEEEKKMAYEVSAASISQPTICGTCTTSAKHFHDGTPMTFQKAIVYIKNYGHDCVKDVPVNIKHSKTFFIHRGNTSEWNDVTCDDMPWVLKKGKTTKKYHVKCEGGLVKECWPESSGTKEDAKMMTVLKRKWTHAHEKKASKLMYEIVNEPIVLVQYLGLDDQPTLKLGNRHTRKSTTNLIKEELKSTASLKRLLYNVEEKVTESDQVRGPSSLPTMRTIKHLKQKAKNEKVSTTTAIMYKMADHDKFVRSYDVSDNVMSVVLFDDRQLGDIKKFCCNDEAHRSSFTVDTTFKFGNFFVVTTSYRHLQLKTVNGNHPVLLGPIMITHKLERKNYRVLFDTMTRVKPSLSSGLSAFVTDGEQALAQALHEAFPVAVGRLCMTHIERNIKHYAENKLKLSKSFSFIVIGDLRGTKQHKGLIDSNTYSEYAANLIQLYEKWDELETIETGQNKVPRFSKYFRQHKAQAVFDHCRTAVAIDLGLIDIIADNNPPESMHAAMRRWQNFQKDEIPQFISAMEKLKNAQQNDCDGAFVGRKGPYSLRDEYGHLKIAPDTLYGEGVNAGEKEALLKKAQEAPVVMNPQASVGDASNDDQTLFQDGCLDHLTHIPKDIRSSMLTFSRLGNGTNGFEEGTMLFRKTGNSVFISVCSRNSYKCECRTFTAYKICHHVMCHARRDGRLREMLKRVGKTTNNVDQIANLNQNPRAGKKQGPPRIRVGRPTGDGRKNLQETLPKKDKKYTAEPVNGCPIKLKLKVINPAPVQTGVNVRPEKPQLIPTLGYPFIVKKVCGNIRKCFGCGGSLLQERLCVGHTQIELYYNAGQRKWLKSRPGNKHFHKNSECIRAGNNPGFKVDMLQLEDEDVE